MTHIMPAIETHDFYVLKLSFDKNATKPRWVQALGRRALVTRDKATVFPNHAEAEAELVRWMPLAVTPFSVVIEPA